MEKFVIGDGQYVVYADNIQVAGQIIGQELQRFDRIKEMMANLFIENGVAYQNFMENTSEENLNIHFNDETSLIYDNPENATTKGEVRQRQMQNGRFTYDLAYRYPEINGHDADFRLAHEIGHLVLNPSQTSRQIYDKETDSRQVSGLIRRTEDGKFYGLQIQENAINLLAQLAIRGEARADDIIAGKVDLSEFNSYRQCDDLVKLLAVSMRNDFDKEMSFEELVENKLDSLIEHSDGTREPANTFFYGVLNDSSIVENEFDRYMGKGAWRELDSAITELHGIDTRDPKYGSVSKAAQELITEFANIRMQEKHKEAVARDGNNVPSLESKMKIISQLTRIEERQGQQTIETEISMPAGYSINQYDEIIRPSIEQTEQKENKPSLIQRIARGLQNNNLLMNVPFIKRFVDSRLNVLPSATEPTERTINEQRQRFINRLNNNGVNDKIRMYKNVHS